MKVRLERCHTRFHYGLGEKGGCSWGGRGVIKDDFELLIFSDRGNQRMLKLRHLRTSGPL